METSLPVAERPRRPEWMKVRAPSKDGSFFDVQKLRHINAAYEVLRSKPAAAVTPTAGSAAAPVRSRATLFILVGLLIVLLAGGVAAAAVLPEATVSAPGIESRHGWSRCRPLRHGARRGDSAGSSLARRDGSRPSEPFVEF